MSERQPGTLEPDDLLAEGERARKISSGVEGVRATVEGVRLVNDAILAHVLFALWDCGFYEYSLRTARFRAADAAAALKVDAAVFGWLADHLVGRGLLRRQGDELELTPRGAALSNALVRGSLNLYLGGYGALLGHLAPLLRGERTPSDPALARSGRHTGLGSEQLAAVRVVPALLKRLAGQGYGRVLDLGCGAGGFLIQLARTDPAVRGTGVDASAAAVAAARDNARRFGVSDRVDFVEAEVGPAPLPLPDAVLREVGAVTAMYLLHEFGRSGRAHIVAVLRGLRAALPGRRLFFAECFPADADEFARHPPSTFSQLDYRLIHPLSGQGLPLSTEEWTALLGEAGLALVEMQPLHWTGLYVAET